MFLYSVRLVFDSRNLNSLGKLVFETVMLSQFRVAFILFERSVLGDKNQYS